MKVITFYSFKGGVGRTISLLSAAYTLARRGRKVLVADWDLQAPGLSLMQCLRPKGDGLPRLGILEYLAALHPDRWGQQQPTIEEMLLAPHLIDEARQLQASENESQMRGDMFFIPAGDLGEGVEKFIENVKRAELHNLKSFLVDLDQDPRMVFKVFRQQVESATIPWRGAGQEGPPDYLLIDSRTGITEIGDLLLGDATDFTMIVYGQDEQNLEGLRIVLNASQRQPGDLAANTALIWSGAVAGQEELKVQQQRHKQRMIEQVCRPDSLGLPESFPKEFIVPFNPDLVYSDIPLVHRVPDGEFARQFGGIADYLEERCLWRDNIIESIIAPIDPENPISEEQRRVKIAATPESQKDAHLQQAYLELDLARGLTQLLFSPPPWNLAGVPTPELVEKWPDGFSSVENQKLFLQLLPYSISLTARAKRSIVKQMENVSELRARGLVQILSEERHKWLTLSPNHFWDLIQFTIATGIEWLAMLAQPIRPQVTGMPTAESRQQGNGELSAEVAHQLDRALALLIEGEPISRLAVSSHPLFPLLVAETLRAAASIQNPYELLGEASLPIVESRNPRPDLRVPFLAQWLATRKLDPIASRVKLTGIACTAVEGQDLPNSVLGYCWERHADSLDDRGRAVEETEKAGWFDRAIEAYERSLKLRPDDPDTLHNLGNSLGDRGRAAEETEKAGWFDRAIEAYERSLKLRPDHADTLHNLGNSLGDRGRAAQETEKADWFDRAIEAYERSLKLRPDHADTLHNLGTALANRGRATEETEKAGWFDRAIEAYERSLKLRPDHADTLNNLTATLLRKWRVVTTGTEKQDLLSQAAQTVKRAIELDAPTARYNHACVLALTGETDEALQEVRQVLVENPGQRQQIAKDEDFDSLAAHPKFRELISGS